MKERNYKSSKLTILLIAVILLIIFSVSACSYSSASINLFSAKSSILTHNQDISITLFRDNKEYTLYKSEITADLTGDGKCTAADARELLRISASLSSYNGDIKNIDIDYDEKITSSDARYALRYSAMLDVYYTEADFSCEEGFYKDNKGNTFYLFTNGRRASGITQLDGAYYFFDNSGKMQTGVRQENSVLYNLGADGKGCGGTASYEGKAYLFADSGRSYTGIYESGGKKLYYKNGTVYTGWLHEDGSYYYQNGEMLRGKQVIEKGCYYFGDDGKMVTSKAIDGITYGADGKAVTADASFFDDAIFIGDSVSVKLAAYQQQTKCFGNATMCAASSLSAANSLWPVSDASVHPYYNGRKTLVEDSVKLSGKKKVFIMLGMNDIGLYSQEASIKNYKELVARIKAKSPDVDIYIQSMTLMTSISERADKSLNNTQIKAYNKKLQAMCSEMGWHYLDVASGTCDSTGNYLPVEYCSDPVYMGLHFSTEGCKKWVNYLYQNVLLV